MKNFIFNWEDVSYGETKRYYVQLVGHAATITLIRGVWNCISDGKERPPRSNEFDARRYAEQLILKKIAKRIKKAKKELELLTDPVFIVDHVGSSYGNGPTDPTVIVGHSCTDTKLLTRCTKVFVLG